MNSSLYLEALPCNHKLVELFLKYPQNMAFKRQIHTELCLEKQKIFVVLRFIFISGKLTNELSSVYKKRIQLIDLCIQKLNASATYSKQHNDAFRCHSHGSVKTCDFVTEAAAILVSKDRKACDKWMKQSTLEIKKRRRKWKHECSKKPMGKVNWRNFNEAYTRITEWAVDECLENQLKDIRSIDSN